jgi:hypothetical protein
LAIEEGAVAAVNKAQIEIALNRAIDRFVECDCHLLAADANERSMSHRIAIYLEQEMPGYNVDCEYNRDGFDVKRLQLSPYPTSADNDEAVTVFPDIIVHRRGNNDHNLLVVEMKKAAAGTDLAYDLQKLRAFRRELKYTWAVHLIIGHSRNGHLVRKTRWIDG